ncbi:MAG: DUF4410 domain-containing protein [Rhodospirillales bacterium]
MGLRIWPHAWGLLPLPLLLAACTSYSQQVGEPAPATPPQVIAVGRIDAGGTEWERAALQFERSLVTALRDSNAFPTVRSSVPKTLPADGLIVEGKILDADGGSDFYQMLLGEWLAGPAAKVEIRVRGADDRTLLGFTDGVLISEHSVDPRASDPTELKHLIDELAADAANAIIRWSKGQPVNDSLF